MRVRAVVVGGAVAYAAAGPVLAVALLDVAGALVVVAAVLAWAGVGGLLGGLALLAREQQRTLRGLVESQRRTERALAGVPGAVATQLTPRLGDLGAQVGDRIDQQQAALVGRIDTRVLGLHATLRELDRGPRA